MWRFGIVSAPKLSAIKAPFWPACQSTPFLDFGQRHFFCPLARAPRAKLVEAFFFFPEIVVASIGCSSLRSLPRRYAHSSAVVTDGR